MASTRSPMTTELEWIKQDTEEDRVLYFVNGKDFNSFIGTDAYSIYEWTWEVQVWSCDFVGQLFKSTISGTAQSKIDAMQEVNKTLFAAKLAKLIYANKNITTWLKSI